MYPNLTKLGVRPETAKPFGNLATWPFGNFAKKNKPKAITKRLKAHG
jgi:hypothetical protein